MGFCVLQLAFHLNKAYLEGYGLTVDPESVPKLQGAPEYESIEMTLSLNTMRCKAPNGIIDLTLPLEVKYGPAILLSVKCQIMIPEVKLSHDVLDFGEVQSGHCKVMMVQVSNPKEVPCEWGVKKPVEATKTKDWTFFHCEPQEGYLDPGDSCVFKVLDAMCKTVQSPFVVAWPTQAYDLRQFNSTPVP